MQLRKTLYAPTLYNDMKQFFGLDGGVLVYARAVTLEGRSLPPEQYEAYRQFVLSVVQADEAQVVLRRDR